MLDLKTLFRTEAGGRKYNEDNGKILRLGDNKGVLLIVCDGMGGMKAGEVASALAVATIEEWFSSDRLTPQVMSAPMEYLKHSIIGADTNIKNYTKTHPETEGMGTTAVLAWLLGEKVYVGWCGDSRAYRYNPLLGLERLSHDHSLVQSWVDAGQITEEQAFGHPQSNIITRTAEYILYNNDVYLLCSDGLCGTLRDSEIGQILSQHKDLSQCCEQLWRADEAAGWHDNVTTAMAQVLSGGAILSTVKQEGTKSQEMEILESHSVQKEKLKTVMKLLKSVIVLGVLLCAFIFAYLYFSQKKELKDAQKKELPQKKDSVYSADGTVVPSTQEKGSSVSDKGISTKSLLKKRTSESDLKPKPKPGGVITSSSPINDSANSADVAEAPSTQEKATTVNQGKDTESNLKIQKQASDSVDKKKQNIGQKNSPKNN